MQPLEEKMEQQQEQLEQNEEMEQAQEQEQLEETPQDDAPEGYRIDFAVRYVDIFEGLEATDKADGTNKKPKRLFVILTLLMCAQVIWYAYSGNGFALVFAIVLGAMALVLRNSYQKANRAIAKAFEEEGDQCVIVGEEKLYLNEKEVAYSEDCPLLSAQALLLDCLSGQPRLCHPQKCAECGAGAGACQPDAAEGAAGLSRFDPEIVLPACVERNENR